MSDGAAYYNRLTAEFSCGQCGWSGMGADLKQGELFRQVVELDCPACGAKVTHFGFPSVAETEEAAAHGINEAKVNLRHERLRENYWARVLESRKAPVAPYNDPVAPIRARLEEVRGEDGQWFVLTLNGVEVHRELAAFEDMEPAERLLAYLQEEYGDRLRSFDALPADYYLTGDSSWLGSKLRRLADGLPEGDGRGR